MSVSSVAAIVAPNENSAPTSRPGSVIDAHPILGIANRFGIPDCPERAHWEEEFALEVGAPGAYDYGPERSR